MAMNHANDRIIHFARVLPANPGYQVIWHAAGRPTQRVELWGHAGSLARYPSMRAAENAAYERQACESLSGRELAFSVRPGATRNVSVCSGAIPSLETTTDRSRVTCRRCLARLETRT